MTLGIPKSTAWPALPEKMAPGIQRFLSLDRGKFCFQLVELSDSCIKQDGSRGTVGVYAFDFN